jgi:hypothetical protein
MCSNIIYINELWFLLALILSVRYVDGTKIDGHFFMYV